MCGVLIVIHTPRREEGAGLVTGVHRPLSVAEQGHSSGLWQGVGPSGGYRRREARTPTPPRAVAAAIARGRRGVRMAGAGHGSRGLGPTLRSSEWEKFSLKTCRSPVRTRALTSVSEHQEALVALHAKLLTL